MNRMEYSRALIEELFESGKAHRVIAMCNPENRASFRLLERLGMRREGILQKNIWFVKDTDGVPVWQDTYEYAVLKEEWKKTGMALYFETIPFSNRSKCGRISGKARFT